MKTFVINLKVINKNEEKYVSYFVLRKFFVL